MLKITIPEGNLPEKEYIIRTMLVDFLGIEIKTVTDPERFFYTIELPNKKKIRIREQFFSGFWNDTDYLDKSAIPDKVIVVDNPFRTNEQLNLVFGADFFDKSPESTEADIDCGYDIFASAFFMLSRWEENVITEKDEHGRFPDKLSFVVKNDIYKTPIVNTYVEFLWDLLLEAGYNGERKARTFESHITHDVDFFQKFDDFNRFLRISAGNLLSRKSPYLFFQDVFLYLEKLFSGKDPYDTFDFLMDISEQNNLVSTFNILPGFKGEKDVWFDIRSPEVEELLQKIHNRNHKIGFHPSYDAFNNRLQFREELERLSKAKPAESKIDSGRQHFLRFSIPYTWRIWEEAGLKKHMGVGFSSLPGFRTGVCYPYKPFDVLERRTLNIEEYSLHVMEVAVDKHAKKNDMFLRNIMDIIKRIKKYNGNFVLLWHNSNLNDFRWRKRKDIYKKIIKASSGS
ncbi:MAG: hypothetical protein EA412_11470 [Chitinophagaceae bacterium]|nr:MAG: hypothetical protein EA412_11470 [Chitinophagaceae bacterium]